MEEAREFTVVSENSNTAYEESDWSGKHTRIKYEMFLFSILFFMITTLNAAPKFPFVEFGDEIPIFTTRMISIGIFITACWFCLSFYIRSRVELAEKDQTRTAIRNAKQAFEGYKKTFDIHAGQINVPDFEGAEKAIKTLNIDAGSKLDELKKIQLQNEKRLTSRHKINREFHENMKKLSGSISVLMAKSNDDTEKGKFIKELTSQEEFLSLFKSVDKRVLRGPIYEDDTGRQTQKQFITMVEKHIESLEKISTEMGSTVDKTRLMMSSEFNSNISTINSSLEKLQMTVDRVGKALSTMNGYRTFDKIMMSLWLPLLGSLLLIGGGAYTYSRNLFIAFTVLLAIFGLTAFISEKVR